MTHQHGPDLDEYLAVDDDDTIGELPADPTADLLRAHLHRLVRVRAAKHRIRDRINAEAAAHLATIGEWREQRLAAEQVAERTLDTIDAAIETALTELRRIDPKTKSVSTPYGTVASTQRTDWRWPADMDELVAWLTVDCGRHDLTRMTVTVDKTALKKATVTKDGRVLLDGEPIPGLEVIDTVHVTIRPNDTTTEP